jgi:hypothetical protein
MKKEQNSDEPINPALRVGEVMRCGLSEVEFTERERLLELQRSRTRWFSQQEFDRLKELSNKMFTNAGSPHSVQLVYSAAFDYILKELI